MGLFRDPAELREYIGRVFSGIAFHRMDMFETAAAYRMFEVREPTEIVLDPRRYHDNRKDQTSPNADRRQGHRLAATHDDHRPERRVRCRDSGPR